MKVLHTVPAFAPEGRGGIERHVQELAAAQQARGHDVAVLAGSAVVGPGTALVRERVDGVRVLRLQRDDPWHTHHARACHAAAGRLVADLLACERPDVLHVHHWLRLSCTLVELATRVCVPTVVTLHDVIASCPRGFRVDRDQRPCGRPFTVATCRTCAPRSGHEDPLEVDLALDLLRRAMRHELTAAGAVLAHSRRTLDFVAAMLDIALPQAHVVPFGVDLPATAAPPPHPAHGGDAAFRFAHWGNLGRHKGVTTLLDAARRLAARPGARPFALHLFGAPESASLADELQTLARGLPVHWHGPFAFADVQRSAPHAAVFPSWSFETFSYVLAEGHALGLPCITSDLGVLPERVGAGGLVVPAQDADALARAMARFCDEPELWSALAGAVPTDAPRAADHAAALERIYAEVRIARPTTATPAVPAERWDELWQRQRRSAAASDHAADRGAERDGAPR
jgi:glycosyltransferase involved in cell wall biosynthesis